MSYFGKQFPIDEKKVFKGTGQENLFVKTALKSSAQTMTGNGGVAFSTTGDEHLDDFGSFSKYGRKRTYAEVSRTMATIWTNPVVAVKLTLYNRMISRNTALPNGEQTEVSQIGQGNRHETYMRLFWIAQNYPKVFKSVLPIFIAAGSWRDVFTMMRYDLDVHGPAERVLPWDYLLDVIKVGISDANQVKLLTAYLPQKKSPSNMKMKNGKISRHMYWDTQVAKIIINELWPEYNEGDCDLTLKKDIYKRYRQLKGLSSKSWQKLISQGRVKELDFDKIHGRALTSISKDAFLSKHGLTKRYLNWIGEKPVAKFTGYPYELLCPPVGGTANKMTRNAQFMKLIEQAVSAIPEDSPSGLLPVVDTSHSMSSTADGVDFSAMEIAYASAVYMSYMCKGPFQNIFGYFSRKCEITKWKGVTPIDRYQTRAPGIVADTNFLSIAEKLIEMKEQGVPESDFPEGIVCFSDGEFNNTGYSTAEKSLRKSLLYGGFSKEYVDNFMIVLWNVPNSYYGNKNVAFQTYGEHSNVYYMSGFDTAGLAFLFGKQQKDPETGEVKLVRSKPKDAKELMINALDQEIMLLIEEAMKS